MSSLRNVKTLLQTHHILNLRKNLDYSENTVAYGTGADSILRSSMVWLRPTNVSLRQLSTKNGSHICLQSWADRMVKEARNPQAQQRVWVYHKLLILLACWIMGESGGQRCFLRCVWRRHPAVNQLCLAHYPNLLCQLLRQKPRITFCMKAEEIKGCNNKQKENKCYSVLLINVAQ